MKTRTWLDYAVWGAAALVVALGAYLAYSVWAQNAYNENTSPAARAVKNLQNLARKNPNDVGTRVRLAEAYAAAGRLDQAVEQYNEALKLDKENAFALVGLGQIAMERKQWTIADGYWHRTIDKLKAGQYAGRDTNLEMAYYYLGTSQFEQHRYEDAATFLKEAIRIRPDASDTHYLLSVTYSKLDLMDQSRNELNATLAFDPLMPEANYDLGQLLLKDGKIADAAEHFRLSADSAQGVDKPEEALRALGSVDDHVRKANELAAAGKVASGTIEARVAVAIDPMNEDALRLLAKLSEKQKDTQRALDAYAKLAKLLPQDKDVAAALARLKKNGGK